MVTGTWLNSSEVFFRLGAENTSTTQSQGAADRLYSMWFKTFRYLGATYLPVTLINWKAELAKNNVNLKWTSTMEKNAKEYIIERSFNGREFSRIGVVAAAGNSENRKDYAFTDKTGNYDGMIYYRLKSADIDGKDRISEIRTVRAGKSTEMSIVTYPNPVVNELKITVPSNWQGKKIMYEVFNVNGSAVLKMVRENAAVTESLHVNSLRAGMYVVRVTSGTESAFQQVIKSN
jgi:hypothetical protein